MSLQLSGFYLSRVGYTRTEEPCQVVGEEDTPEARGTAWHAGSSGQRRWPRHLPHQPRPRRPCAFPEAGPCQLSFSSPSECVEPVSVPPWPLRPVPTPSPNPRLQPLSGLHNLLLRRLKGREILSSQVGGGGGAEQGNCSFLSAPLFPLAFPSCVVKGHGCGRRCY